MAEPNDDRPYPFKRLRNELRLRHGLDSRLWYGLPFRHFMLRAERAGHVHLSTIGGLDYASLARSAPRLDAASLETLPVATAASSGAPEVRLESLTEDEQRSLVGFLKRLQDRSPYMVRKYIVDNLEYGSILPRLSRDQLDRLVLTLAERHILAERRETVTNPATGDNIRAETLTLNEHPPFVQERLSRADPFGLLDSRGAGGTADQRHRLLPAGPECAGTAVGWAPERGRLPTSDVVLRGGRATRSDPDRPPGQRRRRRSPAGRRTCRLSRS